MALLDSAPILSLTKNAPGLQPQLEASGSIPAQRHPTKAVSFSAGVGTGTKSRRKRRAARNDSLTPHTPKHQQTLSGFKPLAVFQQSEIQSASAARRELLTDESSLEEAEVTERGEKEKVQDPPLSRTPSASDVTTPLTTSLKPGSASLPAEFSLLPISANADRAEPQRPLDLFDAQHPHLAPGLPSVLASAKKINDLDSVIYPEGIKTPVEMNQGQTKGGKYQYDRDFLLQFMEICKIKPDNLSSLDALGIQCDAGGDSGPPYSSLGRSRETHVNSTSQPQPGQSSSVNLGIGLSGFGGKVPTTFVFGSFPSTPPNEDKPESEEKQAAPIKWYTEEEAKAKAEEDAKDFFNVRDLSEGEKSFVEMPDEHKSKLVDKLADTAVESNESDVELVADLFERVASKGCPAWVFEDGLARSVGLIDDIEVFTPGAYKSMARLLRGTKLSQAAVDSMAGKIWAIGDVVSGPDPKGRLLKAYAALSPPATRSEAEAFASLPAQAHPTATSSTADDDGDIGQFITGMDRDPFAVNGHFGDVFKGVHRTMGVVALKRLRVGAAGNENRVIRYVKARASVNRIKLLCETAIAIDYLHQRSLVHGDIKANNLLISDDDHVLLCDFGLTKAESAQTSTTMKGTGSLRWQSPELWDNGPKTMKSDVYAFSMTIVEVWQLLSLCCFMSQALTKKRQVLTGSAPFADLTSYPAIFKAIYVEDKRPRKSPVRLNGISYENAWKVAEGCWSKLPEKRMSISEALCSLSKDPSLVP
ncbi:hypothetical protein FRC01_007896 [Tulasnella sp. 417]|nr:hypothetical protein FRC01_007896 [Tulasnella sp. 417]